VVWAVVTCGAIVLAAEPPTIALLRRGRVLDVPGTRSSHSIATPRGGGAPIAVGLLAAAAVAVASGAVAAGLAFAHFIFDRVIGGQLFDLFRANAQRGGIADVTDVQFYPGEVGECQG